MLEPKTPLPWEPFIPTGLDCKVTYGITARDGLDGVCQFGCPDDIDFDSGGFIHTQDMQYAVYAANLLPKLIEKLEDAYEEMTDQYGKASRALERLHEAGKLVETYRP